MKNSKVKVIEEYTEYDENGDCYNGATITRYESPKRKDKTIIPRGSKTMHQKGAFGWRPPTGNGVSSIYNSEHNRKGRGKQDQLANSKIDIQKRNW